MSDMNLLADTKKLLDTLPPLVNCWIAGGAARDIFGPSKDPPWVKDETSPLAIAIGCRRRLFL